MKALKFNPADYNELNVRETAIPGLLHFRLPVHGDNRGWFKENYQREKLLPLGLPEDFVVVQNNISYNETRGVTRGIHAEPWDKFISIAYGSVFTAIVDLREGSTYGALETLTLTPGDAIYVPRGCGNSFQTLDDHTVYAYLVNEHWSAEAEYTLINLADPELAIDWPIPLDQAEISDKDKSHPTLAELKRKA
jgi:dTDP-4-dehydrorhamnose 3,5-epimerase/reductase